jgi:hypothetical protein
LCYPAERLHRLKSVILHNALPASSSNGSSKDHHRQPHPLHVELQDHYAQHVEWLPVKIYQAEYTAELHGSRSLQESSSILQESSSNMQESSSSKITHRWWLQHDGIPLLHSSQQHSWRMQQQMHPAGHYEISSWQSSWCSNLGGMWSEYYKVTAREPNNTQLAPWVLKRYRKYKRLSERLKGGTGADG